MEFVVELAEFMGYCGAEKVNKETTFAGELVVINLYLELFVGLSLPRGNPLSKSVRQGIKRAHVEKGTQQRVRRPLTWGYTDEHAGERLILGGRGKDGLDRLGVVLTLDATVLGVVRGGEGGLQYHLFFAEGGCGVYQK